MAVAVDAVSTAVTNSGTAVTSFDQANLTITAALSNPVLLYWAFTDTTATSLTLHWDSAGTNQLMTLIGQSAAVTGVGIAYLFGLINPTSGAKNLHATWTTSGECSLFGASWSGVSQTSIASAFPNFNSATGNADPATVSITSAVGDAVVGSFIDLNSFNNPNNTSLFNDTAANLYSCAGNRAAGAASPVAMTATLIVVDAWAAIGCDIAASGAADILRSQACM